MVIIKVTDKLPVATTLKLAFLKKKKELFSDLETCSVSVGFMYWKQDVRTYVGRSTTRKVRRFTEGLFLSSTKLNLKQSLIMSPHTAQQKHLSYRLEAVFTRTVQT
jgi:hypothetical protein